MNSDVTADAVARAVAVLRAGGLVAFSHGNGLWPRRRRAQRRRRQKSVRGQRPAAGSPADCASGQQRATGRLGDRHSAGRACACCKILARAADLDPQTRARCERSGHRRTGHGRPARAVAPRWRWRCCRRLAVAWWGLLRIASVAFLLPPLNTCARSSVPVSIV